MILLSSIISIIFISCNKDDAVSPGGGTTPGPQTATFSSNPNITIAPTSWTSDSLNANITLGIDASNVSDVKLILDTLEGVTVSNLQFVLEHNGTEIMVIDYLTNVPSSGNITNLILSDSASNPIMGVSGYPISGTYSPLNPLSGFDNFEASGYWKLRVYNSGSLRTGVIKSWGITITYNRVQTPTLQLFPTAVGNNWVLEGKDTTGYVYGYDSLAIPYTFTYQNKTLYRLYQTDQPDDTIYVNNESDGVYMYRFENNVLMSRLLMKYPINVGQMYIGGGDGEDTVYCTSINETVQTPSGNYSGCIKYVSYRYGQIKSIFYAQPGTGVIGIDHYQNNALYDYERLHSFHLNK